MASMRLFEQQDADYRESFLPPSCSSRVAVEAGVTFGWDRWVGDGGVVIGVDHFGASAPAPTLFQEFGFTADNVYARAKSLLA
jgi:transketolase